MECQKDHRYLPSLATLPDSQGGPGRHKCAGCAYDQGYDHALRASDNKIDVNALADSQAGTGRHKDIHSAYDLGYSLGLKEEECGQIFQSEVGNALPSKPDTTPQLKGSVRTQQRTCWPRDPSRARRALEDAKYVCEIDPSHRTFITRSAGKPYMEAHHLVSMAFQDDFDNQLDVTPNILSLCPSCHRMLHYGKNEDVKKLLGELLIRRTSALKLVGIDCSIERLIQLNKLF